MVTSLLVVKSIKEKWPTAMFLESLIVSLLIDFVFIYALIINLMGYFKGRTEDSLGLNFDPAQLLG